jgi:hypothetical protein
MRVSELGRNPGGRLRERSIVGLGALSSFGTRVSSSHHSPNVLGSARKRTEPGTSEERISAISANTLAEVRSLISAISANLRRKSWRRFERRKALIPQAISR